METIHLEGNIQHVQADHDTVTLERGQRGGYGWTISVRGPDADELLARIHRIDQELRSTYRPPENGE